MKTRYSEYVRSCMRFYARYPNPEFRSVAYENDWNACHTALNTFSQADRELLVYMFTSRDTLADNIYTIAKEANIDQMRLWSLERQLEKKIAKLRGLL